MQSIKRNIFNRKRKRWGDLFVDAFMERLIVEGFIDKHGSLTQKTDTMVEQLPGVVPRGVESCIEQARQHTTLLLGWEPPKDYFKTYRANALWAFGVDGKHRAQIPSKSMEERDLPSMQALDHWSRMASKEEIFRTGGVAKSAGFAIGPLEPEVSRERVEISAKQLRNDPTDQWLASTEALYYVPAVDPELRTLRFPWGEVKSITSTGLTGVAPCSVFIMGPNAKPEGLDLQLAEGADLRLISIFEEFRRSN